MESLIETFHIDYKILIAQIVNFAIVFSVLYYFVLRPLLKVMHERTSKIEKSLDDAKDIENKLAQTKEEYNLIIANAKKEANEVLVRAQEVAEKKKQESIVKAKEEIGVIINQEKAKLQSEKAQTMKEIKKEVADLVVLSMEKILGEKMDEKKDKEMVKKIIS